MAKWFFIYYQLLNSSTAFTSTNLRQSCKIKMIFQAVLTALVLLMNDSSGKPVIEKEIHGGCAHQWFIAFLRQWWSPKFKILDLAIFLLRSHVSTASCFQVLCCLFGPDLTQASSLGSLTLSWWEAALARSHSWRCQCTLNIRVSSWQAKWSPESLFQIRSPVIY